ncbi:hypothetical protein BT63DRAFT_457813 [Microthyrium microscopicum]|uniref:Uncharacterized protein n=1 Tax=Microthyrium microscopicum TaxID=703497 RepID=A0A6A6U3L7_9PEZI|nr:hypothetical protein BT63DRAFT_457813 [Microthyrium microscopicum]
MKKQAIRSKLTKEYQLSEEDDHQKHIVEDASLKLKPCDKAKVVRPIAAIGQIFLTSTSTTGSAANEIGVLAPISEPEIGSLFRDILRAFDRDCVDEAKIKVFLETDRATYSDHFAFYRSIPVISLLDFIRAAFHYETAKRSLGQMRSGSKASARLKRPAESEYCDESSKRQCRASH